MESWSCSWNSSSVHPTLKMGAKLRLQALIRGVWKSKVWHSGIQELFWRLRNIGRNCWLAGVWAGVACSLVTSWLIKQIKDLDVVLTFAFSICSLELAICGAKRCLCKWRKLKNHNRKGRKNTRSEKKEARLDLEHLKTDLLDTWNQD